MPRLSMLKRASATLGTLTRTSPPRHSASLTITPSGGFIFTQRMTAPNGAVITQRLESEDKRYIAEISDYLRVEQPSVYQDFASLINTIRLQNESPTSNPETLARRQAMARGVANMMEAHSKSVAREAFLQSPVLTISALGVMAAGVACYYGSVNRDD